MNKRVTVIHSPGFMYVSQDSIEVSPGDTVTFTFSPNVPNGVAAQTKDNVANNPPAPWLDGTSSQAGTIVIAVPPNTPHNTQYKYDIEIPGVGSLDPYFHVN